ncbi:UNVERIFIED_CONTAM: hypothetical protein GTU68_045174 [Idotea baltica]|nr:hypothetical protein [Idotea baltica]
MKHKILVADDEPDILEFLQYNLQKEGFIVLTANNGADAIEIAERENPDLILLDIMMPELDGIEACRELRTRKQFAKTVIAFLTARSEDYSQIAGFDAGGDDYITKPIRPRVLISRVKALLRRKDNDASTANVFTYGVLMIDTENISVKKNDISINLAKKEYEVLVLLASKPAKVFTRQEIFNQVWGTDLIVGERTIDVHIRKIREKIGNDYIKTLKGIGYKFNP